MMRPRMPNAKETCTMRSTLPRLAARLALLPALLLVSACASTGALPPRADLIAATEAKPAPDDAIATDPVAEAHYNASVEAWGDRVQAAGARLCRFFQRRGMKDLDCPGRD